MQVNVYVYVYINKEEVKPFSVLSDVKRQRAEKCILQKKRYTVHKEIDTVKK